jgi:acetyl esterase/lipase
MHRALRAAGVDAKLHVWEAAGHGGVLGMAPEDADRYAELRRFAERHWTAATEIIDSARPEKTWRPPRAHAIQAL